ncbi:MAG: hypothetical protein JWN04_5940, partial [Myxococcaceae bacterium]|nr:hypothetical protein [Myxococcaceae bacterium]
MTSHDDLEFERGWGSFEPSVMRALLFPVTALTLGRACV